MNHTLPKNVWVLTLAQALMMCGSSSVVFIGGLIGGKLAPTEKLATFPVACMVIGTALSTIPTAMAMKKFGRKKVFLSVILLAVAAASLASFSIFRANFWLFSFSIILIGFAMAGVQQFRFAAIESVATHQIPKAASYVLLGGLVAAFIGPEIAVMGKDLFPGEYSGSFLLLSMLFLLGFLFLLSFNNPQVSETKIGAPSRSLVEIARQPVFWVAVMGAAVGYAVMSFIMTATPVSMHVLNGHSLDFTKRVIQSHIIAMFFPSIFTAWIISKLGIHRMMYVGLAAYILCIAIAYSGQGISNYWAALVLLGVGWNFLFVGGTALLPQSYAPDERFRVQAFNEFLVFGAQATAALSAGWFVYAIGWQNMLLYTVPFIIFQLFLILRWQMTSRPLAT